MDEKRFSNSVEGPGSLMSFQKEHGETPADREIQMFSGFARSVEELINFWDKVKHLSFSQSEEEVARILSEREASMNPYFSGEFSNGIDINSVDEINLVDLRSAIERTISVMRGKNNFLHSLSLLDESKFYSEVSAGLRIPQELINGAEIRASAFDVSLICQQGRFAEIAKICRVDSVEDTDAFHINGTIFNFIREGPGENINQAIQHESIHNMLDGVRGAYHGGVVSERPRETLKEIYHNIQLALPEERIQLIRTYLHGWRLRYLIDEVHEEFLAGLEEAEQKGKWLTVLPETTSEDSLDKIPDIKVMSTAGKHLFEVDNALKSLSSNSKFPPEMRQEYARAQKEFAHKVGIMIRRTREAMYIASRISPKALEEIHFLAFVLRPSQYHHMTNYLLHRHGEKTFYKAKGTKKEPQEEKRDKKRKRIEDPFTLSLPMAGVVMETRVGPREMEVIRQEVMARVPYLEGIDFDKYGGMQIYSKYGGADFWEQTLPKVRKVLRNYFKTRRRIRRKII